MIERKDRQGVEMEQKGRKGEKGERTRVGRGKKRKDGGLDIFINFCFKDERGACDTAQHSNLFCSIIKYRPRKCGIS